jgi:hypothetical protein
MKIQLILISLLLTACASFNFDSTEFNSFITVKEIADNSIKLCGSPAIIPKVQELQRVMDHQFLYSSYREARPDGFIMAATNLKSMIDIMNIRYSGKSVPSVGYCEEKLKDISLGASTIARVVGRLK